MKTKSYSLGKKMAKVAKLQSNLPCHCFDLVCRNPGGGDHQQLRHGRHIVLHKLGERNGPPNEGGCC